MGGHSALDTAAGAGPVEEQQQTSASPGKRHTPRTSERSDHNRQENPTTFFLCKEDDVPSSHSPARHEAPRETSTFGIESTDSTASTADTDDASVDATIQSYGPSSPTTLRRLLHRLSNTTAPSLAPPLEPSLPSSPHSSRDSPVHPLTRESSASALSGPLTPLHLRSPNRFSTSEPTSTPRSVSLRSLDLSDEDAITDTSSQVEEPNGDGDQQVFDDVDATPMPAPDLVMPSVTMPKRRPFTENGKSIGKLNIAVAGSRGSGKTSLIQAILGCCEDIVHVDRSMTDQHKSITTASSRPYPDWWSPLDDDNLRASRRRSSGMHEGVLERNITLLEAQDDRALVGTCKECFMLTSRTLTTDDGASALNLLSGNGGEFLDMILYILPPTSEEVDLDTVKRLSRLSTVVLVMTKADTISEDEMQLRLEAFQDLFRTHDIDVLDLTAHNGAHTRCPLIWCTSSLRTSDEDLMDASLLMSSTYVPPLVPSGLLDLVSVIFDPDTAARLRHLSARKYLLWRRTHASFKTVPKIDHQAATRSVNEASNASLPHPSEVLVSRPTLSTQPQPHAKQWTSDLKRSLNNERQRFNSTTSPDRRGWLIERWRDSSSLAPNTDVEKAGASTTGSMIRKCDPLGLLHIDDRMRRYGHMLASVLGGCSVLGAVFLFGIKHRWWGWGWWDDSVGVATHHWLAW